MKSINGCIVLLLTLSAVAHAQWEPEIKLSTSDGGSSLNENMGQCIATSGDVVHVVWTDAKNNGSAVYHRRSLDRGATWDPETRLSGNPGLDSFALLAVSGSVVHVVFLRNTGTPNAESFYKHSTDAGKTWGPEVSLGKTKWWPGVAAAGSMVYVSLNTVVAPGNSEVFFRRSKDNGETWEPQQQISNAPGRSEDPAIVACGNEVHLVWNDNRDTPKDPGSDVNKGMAVYYRRSLDQGVTFGPETALTHAPAFTYFPTIAVSEKNADVVYGDHGSGPFNIFYQHSGDSGATWGEKQQMSHSPKGAMYPTLARDGSNVHLVYGSAEGMVYQHSSDGGATWAAPESPVAGKGMGVFVAVSGDIVHLLWRDMRDSHGAIYYKRNLTGNSNNNTVAAKKN